MDMDLMAPKVEMFNGKPYILWEDYGRILNKATETIVNQAKRIRDLEEFAEKCMTTLNVSVNKK